MHEAQAAKLEGNQAFQDGRYASAVSSFSYGIYHDPTDHVLYSNRSAARCCLFLYEDALNDAIKCIELAPHWAKGYSRKGVALAFLGRNDEALQAYKEGLKVDPNNATLKENLALLQAKMAAQSSKRTRKNVRWSDPIVTPLTTPSGTPAGSMRGSLGSQSKSLSHQTFQPPERPLSWPAGNDPNHETQGTAHSGNDYGAQATSSTTVPPSSTGAGSRSSSSASGAVTVAADVSPSPSHQVRSPSPLPERHATSSSPPSSLRKTPPQYSTSPSVVGVSPGGHDPLRRPPNAPTTKRLGTPARKPDSQALEPHQLVNKEGWLFKKGGGKGKKRNFARGGRRNWNHRWFVYSAETRVLSYYRSPEEAKTTEPLGILDTEAAYIDDVRPDETHHQLNLCCALRFHDRDFLIAAETQEFINHWRATLCGWKFQMYQNIKDCPCLRAGFLLKKGGGKGKSRNFIKGGRRNWKVRWFQMESAIKLCYYDCQTSKGTKARKLGELYLCQGVVDDVAAFETHRQLELCCALRFPHRDFLISSMNVEDMVSWRQALNWWREQYIPNQAEEQESWTQQVSAGGVGGTEPPVVAEEMPSRFLKHQPSFVPGSPSVVSSPGRHSGSHPRIDENTFTQPPNANTKSDEVGGVGWKPSAEPENSEDVSLDLRGVPPCNGAPSPSSSSQQSQPGGVSMRDIIDTKPSLSECNKLDSELILQQAFRQLSQWGASCVAVVGADDVLLGSLSNADAKIVEHAPPEDRTALLAMTVNEFITTGAADYLKADRPSCNITVSENDPYDTVVTQVLHRGVQDVFVVSTENRLLAALSLHDVLLISTPRVHESTQ